MTKIELPSGNTVEYRTELMAGDRFAVQEAAEVELGDAGKRKMSFLGIENAQRNALLARVITNWSYPGVKPDPNNVAQGAVIIGNTLPLKDYNVLAKEIQPLLDEISGLVVEDPKDSPTS